MDLRTFKDAWKLKNSNVAGTGEPSRVKQDAGLGRRALRIEGAPGHHRDAAVRMHAVRGLAGLQADTGARKGVCLFR